MYFIIQYYNDKNIERQKEYDECLRKNLNNPAIFEIHNIIEKETIIPEEFKKYNKLKNINFNYLESGSVPGRLTFKYIFDYCKKNIPLGEIVCISNLDIFLENSEDWLNIKTNFFAKNNQKKVLALSRYEYYWNGTYKIEKSQWTGASSDVWIFKNDISNNIKDCNFSVGNAPGCDASICKRFYDNNFIVFNWAEKYKIFHLDICRGHFNGNMIITNKTDHEGKNALSRGRLDCIPYQNWSKILNMEIKPFYRILGKH